jgi:hypothetical protein
MSITFWAESAIRRLLFGLNPWLPIFAFVTLFQAIRVSIVDLIYFGIVTLILVADWKNWIPITAPERFRPTDISVYTLAVILGIALYLVPRQSAIGGAIMLLIISVSTYLVWYRDEVPKPTLSKAMFRTKYAWLVLALCLALWELFAYILSDIEGDVSYPTLSVLMAPFLALDFGRVVFLLVWFSMGIFLLRPERK